MALFGKKQEKKEQPTGRVVGFTKPKRFLFFKIRSKPIYENAPEARGPQAQQAAAKPQPQQQPQRAQPQQPRAQPKMQFQLPLPKAVFGARAQPPAHGEEAKKVGGALERVREPERGKRPGFFQTYITSVAARQTELEAGLRAQGMKASPYDFTKRMFFSALIISVIVTVAFGALTLTYGLTPIFAILLGIACFYTFFNRFIRYPIDRSRVVGKEIEKDILFAARDLVISMRSGMPLFNALTGVSTGYGSASLEFAKIVELVQLGMPIEQAIDEISTKSQSRTFKRIMLQATVSLKAGADVVGALQGVVEEVTQERVIELRRYGQRLNALAMFYMLFGVIFPSMGIAVAAILTTFISLFTISDATLLFALVGILFLQIVFLNIMRSSRPTFAM